MPNASFIFLISTLALITYRDLTVAFGDAPVLQGAQFTLEKRERVCLIGRNGEGKSTLLRVLSGEVSPNRAEVERAPNLRIAKLDQEVPSEHAGTVFDMVAQALGDEQALILDYHHTAHALAENPEDTSLADKLDKLQRTLDASGGWALEQHIARAITRVGLDADAPFNTLSGGQKRRVLLARALVNDPQVLLLDEPTNHLDLSTIAWLEDFLLRLDTTLLFVTHDRAFLRKLATRILDLDRGKLVSYDCGYEKYLERKAEALETEAKHNSVFDKKLAQEEVWIRQGIKARRTRNEGRVRALEKLRSERAQRRDRQGSTKLDMQSAQLSGAKVIDVEKLNYAWGDLPIARDFSTTLWRGDKIGIIGANGSGKTTLLQLLLGKLAPDSGTIQHGTKLQVAYFDQLRDQLDTSKTLAQNVSPHSDTVTHNGKSRHIISYLSDFLFSPEDAQAPVTRLSGGERARVLLARLFLQPANVLVMDEPTNDLDIQTIELLEDILLKYSGTLLLVSHDRDFLENVVNASFVLHGDGIISEHVGAAFQTRVEAPQKTNPNKPASSSAKTSTTTTRPKKLSNKEREALKNLPARIEQLEAEHSALSEAIATPQYYEQTGETPAEAGAKLEALENTILETYEQWELLEKRASELGESI